MTRNSPRSRGLSCLARLLAAYLALSGCANREVAEDRLPFPWRFVEIGPLDTGNEQALLGDFSGHAVGVDGKGRVSIATEEGEWIHRFAPNGAWLDNVGRLGSGPGEFRRIHALAVDSVGDLLVYDGLSRRVTHLDGEGRYISSFRAHIATNDRPSLGIGAEDRYWVCDTHWDMQGEEAQESLVLISSSGDTVWSWDARTAPYLYVSVEGRPQGTLGPSMDSSRWAVDADGISWLVLPNAEALLRIPPGGSPIDTVRLSASPLRPSDQEWEEFEGSLLSTMEMVAFLRPYVGPMRDALARVRERLHPMQRCWWMDEHGLLVERMPFGTVHQQSGEWRYAALLPDGRMTKEATGPPRLVTAGYGYAVQMNSDWRELPELMLFQLVPLR